MMEYTFAMLDPGHGRRARARNDAVFAGARVCGIGITAAHLVTRCVQNNLPQGWIGMSTRTVTSAALTCRVPPAGTTLAATVAGLDTLTAMAVLAMRADRAVFAGEFLAGVSELMKVIEADAEWRLRERGVVIGGPHALQAIASRTDRELARRVAAIRAWLESRSFPGMGEAFGLARHDRAEKLRLADAVWLAPGGKIAVLEARSRFARWVALTRATAAIIDNPEYRGDGRPHRRVTVAARDPVPVRLELVRKELNGLERGWGPVVAPLQTQIHSPRHRSCALARPRIIVAVRRHLP